MLTGVGLAGVGTMGRGMLAALRAAGIDARGFDIRPPADFGDLSPYLTDKSDEFVKDLKILITVVRDIAQTDELLFDTQSLVTRAPNLTHIVVSSTLSPRYIRALRDRVPAHIHLIDAPMSGAQIAADNARLSFMLGGDKAELARLNPLFEAMGAHIHNMGAYGNGMQAKVLNNLLAASSTSMTRLVLDWADQTGLDKRALLGLIATSSGQNWLASGFDDIEFAQHGYDPGNSIGILLKDVESALDATPPGADTALPDAVRAALRALKPYRD